MSLNLYSKLDLKKKLSLILLSAILFEVGILGVYFEYYLRSDYAARTKQQIDFIFHRIFLSIKNEEINLKKGIAFIKNDESMYASLGLINSYQDKNNYNAILIDEEKKIIANQLLYRVKLSLNDSIALYDTHQDLISYVYKTPQGYRLNFISYDNNKTTLYSRLESEEEYRPVQAKFPRLIPYHHVSNYSYPGMIAQGVITDNIENGELIVTAHKSLTEDGTNHLIAHIEMTHKFGTEFFKTLSKDLNMHIFSASTVSLAAISIPINDTSDSFPLSEDSSHYKSSGSIATKDGNFYIIISFDKTFQAESLVKNRFIFTSIIITLTLLAIAFMKLLFNRMIEGPLQGLMNQIQIIKNRQDDSDQLIKTGDELEIISNNMHELSMSVYERENMLTRLLELSPIAVQIASSNGKKVLFANLAYARLIHINHSEVQGINPQHCYTHQSEYDEIVQKIHAHEVIHDRLVELYINNQTVWALASYTSIKFENQSCILGWFYDISELKTREKELAHEKQFISTIIDSANTIIAVINADGVMTKINKYGENFTEYSQEEISSEPYFWSRFLPLDVQNKVTDIISNAKKGILIRKFRNSWISKSGNKKTFEWSNALVQHNDGSMDYIATIGVDITEQDKQEKLIQQQKEEFETMFHVSKDPIAILDEESNFLDFNDAYLEMTGFSREELLQTSCIALSIPEDVPRSMEAMKTVFEKGELINYEKTCVVKNGKKIIINMGLSLLPDKKRILISVRDVTESRKYERQLEHIAHYDSLTGLPNRVLNADRLRQAMLQSIRREEQIAVLYLDLDGFKEVNDRYGHNIGDKLLISLASLMQKALRDSDSLSRMGGDEFVAILSDFNDRTMAISVIQRVLNAVSQPIQIDDITVHVSVSIGVVFYPQLNEIDADQLIRQADQAMYEAKQSGKNRFHIFDPDHDRVIREKHQTLERIEQALTNNEFILYYQPKINMRTNEFIGVEALIRWQDPQKGLIPPLEFLPVIENHPLAVSIGEWVINEAITQTRKWQKAGLTTLVSVNVGARQLLQGDFVERLQTIMTQSEGFDPSMLIIEILETSALEDIDHAVTVISECNKIGVRFALDDFGTGYSSLTYLKRLPIVTLKIDQSFVRDMLVDKSDLTILKGIVGLASAFECEILAEGVETYAHGQQLLSLGCEMAQGYGIARPMPADQLLEWNLQWDKEHRWNA